MTIRGALFPVMDRPPYAVRQAAGLLPQSPLYVAPTWQRRIMARWTGERRAPRAGEWFLSGAIVEAYRAVRDLGTVYHIAELVEVEPVPATYRVVRTLPSS